MSINFDLKANSREKLGSAESRRVRNAGNIPAVIYDTKGNIQVSVPTKEFEKEYYKGGIFTTIINLDIVGKVQKVIAHKVDLNPVTDRPTHITFFKAEDGSKVKASVKVRFFNREKSPGIKRGGFLHIITRKIELVCPVESIPQEVTFDIGEMKVGDKIRSIDLDLPENISFANKKEFNIASIIGRGSKDEEENAVTGEAGVAVEGEAATEEGGDADKEESKE
jgi:large subunit ribosomal protein L25